MPACLSRYYPYHYAPFLSDIRNIADLKLTFDLAKPFMPFQQLLAVLPAASMELLPESYRVTRAHTLTHVKYRINSNVIINCLIIQHLMTSEDSPIIEYYPLDFKTDLNGKQQEWEAVVLIPFIDEVHTHRNTPDNIMLKGHNNMCVVFVEQRCLLAAMEPFNDKMTKEEKARNRHTECAVYSYDPEQDCMYTSSLPQLFPDIVHCHVR